MGVFEEDSEIRVSQLINLWVAEGFIRPDGAKVLEEIAEDYINDLISRNLVIFHKARKNGKIRSCRIHDLLRDLCLKFSQQQNLFHATKHEMIRRLVTKSFPSYSVLNPLIRSIIASYIDEDDFELLLKYRLLRVLHKCMSDSPSAELLLYKNVNLRYLAHQPCSGLKPNDMRMLPSSVLLIWNLQTLIIDYDSYDIFITPIEMWKMRQLRHLKCGGNGIFLLDPPPSNNGQDCLENLQTLTMVVNLRLSEMVCSMIPNIKKLNFFYHSDQYGYDDSLIECLHNLDRLYKLESLEFEIKYCAYDGKLSNKLAFPNRLNKLCLRNTELDWDDLRTIGTLPQLQVLELGERSVTRGRRWNPINGQFLHLKFLKISWCTDLRYWDADNYHFPVLEKLVLRKLRKLKKIPVEIGEIPMLGLISVDRCNNDVAISALQIKEERLGNQDDDALQVQLKISPQKEKRFREMVEEEEVTINNIQLEIVK